MAWALLDIFEHINNELAQKSLTATLYVYGGCAMMLTCIDTRRSWDFDFIFTGKPVSELSKILRATEAKFNLPASSFDITIGPLIANHFLKNETTVFSDMSNLLVRLCTPEQLLAMKLFSARLWEGSQDFEDCVELCKLLDVKTGEKMYEVLYRYVKADSVVYRNNKFGEQRGIDIFISKLEEVLNG